MDEETSGVSIRLIQVFCPRRHLLVAMVYDTSDMGVMMANLFLRSTYLASGVREVCGVCGSTDLTFEHRETTFKSVTQANGKIKSALGGIYDREIYFGDQPNLN